MDLLVRARQLEKDFEAKKAQLRELEIKQAMTKEQFIQQKEALAAKGTTFTTGAELKALHEAQEQRLLTLIQNYDAVKSQTATQPTVQAVAQPTVQAVTPPTQTVAQPTVQAVTPPTQTVAQPTVQAVAQPTQEVVQPTQAVAQPTRKVTQSAQAGRPTREDAVPSVFDLDFDIF